MAKDKSRPSTTWPSLRTTVKGIPGTIWDIKFYPYLTSKDDPVILALVGFHDVYICQLIEEDAESANVRFLNTFRREEEHQDDCNTLNSCSWCYIKSSEPLLAITGESGQIQVLNAFTGDLKFTLTGHGVGVVNDIITHPKYPYILASCSIDSSIRIWDLRRPKPCIIICGHNLAHKEGLISINWHQSGNYIVSGGFDHKVCVWTIPDLSEESSFWKEIGENRKRSRDEVKVIHYPHFNSEAIHGNFVDAVMFWDDMILSKAAKENVVVLWSIQGFDSNKPPPLPSQAPKALMHMETRNGFARKPTVNIDEDVLEDGGLVEEAPFKRLLEFKNEGAGLFFMRFGLSQPSALFTDLRTILTVGDEESRIRHWDLERLLTGEDDGREVKSSFRSLPNTVMRDSVMKDSVPSSRSTSVAENASSVGDREMSTGATSFASDQPPNEEGQLRMRYKLHEFEVQQPAHKTTYLNKADGTVTTRGVGWSVCGKWCVAVGELKDTNGDVDGVIIVMRDERE